MNVNRSDEAAEMFGPAAIGENRRKYITPIVSLEDIPQGSYEVWLCVSEFYKSNEGEVLSSQSVLVVLFSWVEKELRLNE